MSEELILLDRGQILRYFGVAQHKLVKVDPLWMTSRGISKN